MLFFACLFINGLMDARSEVMNKKLWPYQEHRTYLWWTEYVIFYYYNRCLCIASNLLDYKCKSARARTHDDVAVRSVEITYVKQSLY